MSNSCANSASDPVTAYAQAVVAGEILTGKWVRLACERHLRDLETGAERGLWFDGDEAARTLAFFHMLPHTKGEWARGRGKITLQPWQAFIIGSVFGWKRADGFRRFRTAYNELARKQGKSTIASGVALKLAFFDGEPGAEVYAAATKRDQAKIVWGDARQMVVTTPALKSRIRAFVNNLHSETTASKFEPLGADADSLDGLNIHGAIVDEVHAHPSRKVVDVLETATGARRQPLIFYITTAGYNRNSVCWELRDYATKVLEGVVEDDTLFAYIACIDEGDAWDDPAVWIKANPGLGVSVKLDDLERKCHRAKEIASEQNAFRRLHCNQWVEQAERWLDMAQWDACDGETPLAAGQPCFFGLDLSTSRDITAGVALFPAEDGCYDVLCDFWVPEENVEAAEQRDRVPYRQWAEQGYLTLTEGNITDYDVIRERVKSFGRSYQIRELPYDPWNATQLATQLGQDGATVVPVGQGYAHLSEPSKQLEALLASGRIRHGGNPVLRWMASNVAIQHGPNESIRPVKDKSSGRIDGIVALVMALSRAMVAEQDDGGSVYERRGLTFF